MISNFSMPVNSFKATASIGTEVMVNRKVNTVKPSAIEMGMPVSIKISKRVKMTNALMVSAPVLDSAQPHPPTPRHDRDHGGADRQYG